MGLNSMLVRCSRMLIWRVLALPRRWLLLVSLFSHLLGETHGDINIVGLVPPSSTEGTNPGSAGYFPSAPSLSTAMKLAAEGVMANGTMLVGNVSITMVQAGTAAVATGGICSALSNSTVMVLSALGSSTASLLGSFSNQYMGLPILTVGATAARSEARHAGGDDSGGAEGGFVLGMQPDIYPQMQALVNLILHMKTSRDAETGKYEDTERVWLLHTNDAYGSTAAMAFTYAAATVSTQSAVVSVDEESSEEAQETSRASVEVKASVVIPASASANISDALAPLVAGEATIVVLLAEGFDGAIVRSVLNQARGVGLTSVQWFLPDAAAMDSVFDVSESSRDAELAYGVRGALGLRVCTPPTGPGAWKAASLATTWQSLDPTDYPGAGPGTLTADDQIDPLLAFAYDAVVLAAAAVGVAQEETGSERVEGYSPDGCPFPPDGPWGNGVLMRDSIYSASTSLVGVTGALGMAVGDGETDGAEADGREASTATFCAVNLRPHSTRGGRFEIIGTLDGEELADSNSTGFQVLSPYQEKQTFPADLTQYPFDRPTMMGRHMKVVVKRNAAPFVSSSSDVDDDFSGITVDFLENLAEIMGFSYIMWAPPERVGTAEAVTLVANGTYDMAASWITINEERSDFVSFTYPYFDLGVAFVYKTAEASEVDLLKAFTPFEPGLWIALLVALSLTVFLLWLYEGAKNDEFSRGSWSRRRRSIAGGLSRSIYVTASLMMTQLTHKPETLEGYLLTLGWLFASFVLAASYTAELASFLTATKVATATVSLEKLRTGEMKHSNVALLQGGNIERLYTRDFINCTDCARDSSPQPCSTTDVCFAMVLNGSAETTLIDSPTAQYLSQGEFCGLELLPDILYPQHYGLVLPLNSPLTDEFAKTTLHLRESGRLDELAEPYLGFSSCPSTTGDDGSNDNLTVSDVSGVFLVLGIFVMLSMISWCLRRSPPVKRIKARRRQSLKSIESEDDDEDLTATFSKLTRKQQKTFALEAAVQLLAESRARLGSTSTTAGTSVAVDSSVDNSGQRTVRREGLTQSSSSPQRRRSHARDISAGRPVVTLSDEGSSALRRRGQDPTTSASARESRTKTRAASSRPRSSQTAAGAGRRRAVGMSVGPMMTLDSGDGSPTATVLRKSNGDACDASTKSAAAVSKAANKWLSKRSNPTTASSPTVPPVQAKIMARSLSAPGASSHSQRIGQRVERKGRMPVLRDPGDSSKEQKGEGGAQKTSVPIVMGVLSQGGDGGMVPAHAVHDVRGVGHARLEAGGEIFVSGCSVGHGGIVDDDMGATTAAVSSDSSRTLGTLEAGEFPTPSMSSARSHRNVSPIGRSE